MPGFAVSVAPTVVVPVIVGVGAVVNVAGVLIAVVAADVLEVVV
jgi:hypothetical protein